MRTLICDGNSEYPIGHRDLDIYVAVNLLGWTMCDVGPDINGLNRCSILTHGGVIPDGITLPSFGFIPIGYLVPEYTQSLSLAMELAMGRGYEAVHLPTRLLSSAPELIVRALIRDNAAQPSDAEVK